MTWPYLTELAVVLAIVAVVLAVALLAGAGLERGARPAWVFGLALVLYGLALIAWACALIPPVR